MNITVRDDQVRMFAAIGFDTKRELLRTLNKYWLRNFVGRPKIVECDPTLLRGFHLVGFMWETELEYFKGDNETKKVAIGSPAGIWYEGYLSENTLTAVETVGGRLSQHRAAP